MQDSEKAPVQGMEVGPKLKMRRQALKLSLAQIELDTKIRGKFLTALEAGDYDRLPNDIYSRGFVQHYASHLGLDGAALAAEYVRERGGIAQAQTKGPVLERPRRIVLTGPIAAVLAVVTVAVAVLLYLLWQFSALAAAPSLAVTSPNTDQVVEGVVINVSGQATPGADVTVNDSPVLSDTDGNFNEKVALQDGVNTIRIVAQSRLGKTTAVTRNVLAKLPRVEAGTASVPEAVFDGVAVAVTARETTSIVVLVDGAEKFRGTFLAGKSLVFSGKTNVSVTTGNAGATSLVVTNAVAANKKLDSLGAKGEIRRNQEFAKDTVIP